MMLDSEATYGGNKIKSVFDLVSYEDRVRLKAFRSKLPGNEGSVAMEDPVVVREPSPVEETVVGFLMLFCELSFIGVFVCCLKTVKTPLVLFFESF